MYRAEIIGLENRNWSFTDEKTGEIRSGTSVFFHICRQDQKVTGYAVDSFSVNQSKLNDFGYGLPLVGDQIEYEKAKIGDSWKCVFVRKVESAKK